MTVVRFLVTRQTLQDPYVYYVDSGPPVLRVFCIFLHFAETVVREMALKWPSITP